MRLFFSTIGVLVLLAGCGGGGGAGTPVTGPGAVAIETSVAIAPAPAVSIAPASVAVSSHNNCIVKPALVPGKYRSAIMDMRFDQLTDLTAEGLMVSSYRAVVPIIDKINCVGFDTVVFQTNIPIDIATGNIQLYDANPVGANRDKSLPKDFWPLVEYAKSKGLRVFVKAIPVNYVSDNVIGIGFTNPALALPSTFSTSQFFKSIESYEVQLATQAEKYKVDGFYVGSTNVGLDDNPYSANWDQVISSIKSVYTGKLIYESCDRCNNVVWKKVDLVAVGIGDAIAGISGDSIAQILNDNIANRLIVNIQNIAIRYQKPILLDAVVVGATGKADDLWGMLNSNQLTYTNVQPNYNLQAIKISAVFELMGARLNNTVNGVQWSEYMPWVRATWILNPRTTQQWNWHCTMLYGVSLYENESAQAKISDYLKRPWGYKTVN